MGEPTVRSKSSYQTEGFYFTKERTADGKITPEELAAMLDECRKQIDYIKTLSSSEKEFLLARENTTLYILLQMQAAQSVHVDPNILLEDHNTIPYEVERRLNNKRTLAANDDPEGNLQHGQPVTSADECITYGLNNRTFYSYYEPGEATMNGDVTTALLTSTTGKPARWCATS